MFATTARYALVLAFALGTIHFNGASARPEKCSTAAAYAIGDFFSPVSLPGVPQSPRENTPDKRIGSGASFVRFSVRSYFTVSGSALTYSARSLHEAVATVDDVCDSMLKVTARSAGTATVTVTAEANGMSQTHTLTVEVADDASFPTSNNRPPEAEGTIADVTFTQVTSSISFFVSPYFSDPDGNSLTYSPSLSPTGMVEASITDSTLTITPVSVGTGMVTVTATDPDAETATQSFDVTVLPRPNRTPLCSDIADQELTAGGSAVTFNLASYCSDPDDDDLTYTAWSSSAGIATAGVSGSTLTITPVAAGNANITVVAREPSNAGAIQSVGVTVSTAAGLSASIDGSSSVTGPGGTTWTASVSGGTTPYTYSWRYQRTCSGGEGGPGDRAAPPCTEWVSGGASSSLTLTLSRSTTLELTVTDADDDSVTATLSVSFDL